MRCLLVVNRSTLVSQPDDFEVRYLGERDGLHELTQDIYNGHVRIGHFREVVIFTGRADVIKGYVFACVLERLITAIKTFRRPFTQCLLMGPFPQRSDDEKLLNRLRSVHHYMEEHLMAEKGMKCCRSAERFCPLNVTRDDYFDGEGLSVEGQRVLMQDIWEDLM